MKWTWSLKTKFPWHHKKHTLKIAFDILKKAPSEYANKAEIRLMTLREIGPQMGALWKNTELQST